MEAITQYIENSNTQKVIDHKKLLCIFFSVPKEGTGSPVILLRHLKYLESKGFDITLVAPEHEKQQENIQNGWKYIFLPKRRFYWLPYRQYNALLMYFRLLMYFIEVKKGLSEKPEIIITLTSDIYSLLAAKLSKYWNVPLVSLLHDQAELMTDDLNKRKWIKKYYPKIFRQSAKVLAVSEQLLLNYNIPAKKGKVLYPVPHPAKDETAQWEELRSEKINIVYAGRIHPYHIQYLKEIAEVLDTLGGNLTLISPDNHQALISFAEAHSNVHYLGYFRKNEEAILYMKDCASALLVLYAINSKEQLWANSSFPSKLLEYTQTSLPILIITPPDTAVYQWATTNNWQGIITEMNRYSFYEYFQQLRNRNRWEALSAQSRYFANTAFSSERINQEFYHELTSL